MPLIPKRIPITDTKQKEIEFINMGWEILYHKCLYYELAHEAKYDFLRISDKKFDKLQKKYEELAKTLKKKPTASLQIGFDAKSGSGSLVLSKVLIDYHYKTHATKDKQSKI